MFKKITIASALIFSCLSTAVSAGTLYAGGTLFIQDTTSNTANGSFRGLNPEFSFGYSDILDNIYLAGEIFGIPATATLSDNTVPGQLSLKNTWGVGLSFIPGIMFSDRTAGFLRLGIIMSNFSGPNVTKTGGRIGLGMQTGITPNWDLRLEYIFTAYHSADGIGSPRVDEFGLGAVYKFDC